MIKSDKKTLSKLSLAFSPADIAQLGRIFTHLRQTNSSTVPGEQLIAGLKRLEEITALQLGKSHYVFHVEDSWAGENTMYGDGTNLYLRQGDALERKCYADYPSQQDFICDQLLEHGFTEVYTGRIPFDKPFLGLEAGWTDDDGDTMSHEPLRKDEIAYFTERGITVTVLDQLL